MIPKSESEFDHDLTRRLTKLQQPAPKGMQKWSIGNATALLVVVCGLIVTAITVPNRFVDLNLLHVSLTLGTLGTWRFGWWFTHAIRAEIYARRVWGPKRAAARVVWAAGWRPRRLHIQMTTYFEEPAITKRVIGSILSQIRREGIPTTLYIGTGSAYDENIIRAFVQTYAQDIPDDLATLVFVRQNQPGKRMAIGLILRAINRAGVHPDDLVIFMDGDALFGNDVLEKTLSMFGADPELQALTTDEEVICYGPKWIAKWLDMRFAQRRLAMQSHALAGKVLTLTGRMSVFRAKNVIDLQFIRTIEADFLDHWLWGRFRFLSGDDKSTWYHLLKCHAKMTYVPDATVYTIEVIHENGMGRMIQNFRRWSGNMLRNGARAIALGPRVVTPFIWWCLVDQRIAMWTMLVSPLIALLLMFEAPHILWSVLLWITASRVGLCLFLFRHSREADMTWPFILYLNQVINASVKVFMIFHLSKQKWANRGGQTAGAITDWRGRAQNGIAKLQMASVVSLLVYSLSLWVGVA
ncbi:MAG: glycosyltransferase [Planktomarina sp.]